MQGGLRSIRQLQYDLQVIMGLGQVVVETLLVVNPETSSLPWQFNLSARM